jgi:D-beta-D-heptose 7-phosphate kinase/D-beta-D-heptose 1-phosphate adenosyltransferase
MQDKAMNPVKALEKIISSFQGARVLVIGDLMLDTYLIGTAARISPEAPVPVVELQVREDRLGGAANCAMNISSLGGEPIIVGAVGRAEAGERFIDLVRQQGFDEQGIVSHDHILTTRKVRVVAAGQQIVRVDEEEPLVLPERLENRLVHFIEKMIPSVGAVSVSDYAKGLITPRIMTALFDLARVRRIPVLVDPKPANIRLYKGCDLMKPNRKETAELAGMTIVDDASCDEAARKVLHEYSPRALLITRGPEGMDLYREGMAPVRVKARVSRVYDVSGAGDTVLATCAIAYSRGVDPVKACKLAVAAASVVVRKPGTSTVTPEELLESLHDVE